MLAGFMFQQEQLGIKIIKMKKYIYYVLCLVCGFALCPIAQAFITYNSKIIPLLIGYTGVTGNYICTLNDYTLNITTNSNVTITLPDGTIFPQNRCLTIKNSGTGNVTLITTASQTIDGSATQTVQAKGGPQRGFSCVVVQNANPNWIIISASLP